MYDVPAPPPGPVVASDETNVDPTALLALTQRLGDRAAEFRSTLVATFCEESAGRLVELDQAVAAADSDGVVRTAHTVKSSSAALGATRLAAFCADLERDLRAGADRDLAADARVLRGLVERAEAQLIALWPPA